MLLILPVKKTALATNGESMSGPKLCSGRSLKSIECEGNGSVVFDTKKNI